MAVMLVLELYFSPFISLDFSGYQWRIQGRGPPPPYFWTKLRPKGPKKNFLETAAPSPLSQGLATVKHRNIAIFQ